MTKNLNLQVGSFIEKHKSLLFYSGLGVSSVFGWLAIFGATVLQRYGIVADYSERTFVAAVMKNPYEVSSGKPEPALIRISYPTSIDFNESRPLQTSISSLHQNSSTAWLDSTNQNVSSEIYDSRLIYLLNDDEVQVDVKPELDAPAFDFEKQKIAKTFDRKQAVEWQWIISPKKEGKQSVLINFTFQAKRKDAKKDQINVHSKSNKDNILQTEPIETEIHIQSKSIEVGVVRAFISLGQLNLATIVTGIIAGLLAAPKLTDLVKALVKPKPKKTTIGYLGDRKKAESPANKGKGKTPSDIGASTKESAIDNKPSQNFTKNERGK